MPSEVRVPDDVVGAPGAENREAGLLDVLALDRQSRVALERAARGLLESQRKSRRLGGSGGRHRGEEHNGQTYTRHSGSPFVADGEALRGHGRSRDPRIERPREALERPPAQRRERAPLDWSEIQTERSSELEAPRADG